MDLSPTAQVTASSSPTPGDATGAFSVGAFDATTLLPEPYSSEGPTDDGRLKPDIAAPTNVLITPGVPESDEVNACGGTSCAAPHVGGAAALLWGDVAADGGAGSVAQRVRDRLVAQALDVGAPGPDTVFGAGRLRLDLAAPVLGVPHAGAELARARDRRALAAAHRRGHARPATAHGGRHAARGDARARRGPAGHLADGRTRRRARTCSPSSPPTRAATSPPTRSRSASTTRRRSVRLRSPLRARARAKVQDLGLGARRRQRPRGPAAASRFGDGTKARGFHLAHRYKRPGHYIVTIRATDRAGNTPSCGGRCASAPRPRSRARDAGVDWRRDDRRRHDGSRSRGGPGDTASSQRARLLGAAQAAHHAADRHHDDRLAGAGRGRLARRRSSSPGPCSA